MENVRLIRRFFLCNVLWLFSIVSYLGFNAMVHGAELSIPAPQAFLGRGDASEGIGRLRRGMGMRNPDGSQRVTVGKRNSVEAKSEK